MSRFDPTLTINMSRLVKDIWAILRNKEISTFKERISLIELHCSENPSGTIVIAVILLVAFVFGLMTVCANCLVKSGKSNESLKLSDK